MQYRRLGTSNLQVSALCLGTMMFGDPTDAAEAGRIVAHAHAAGVNFIDTADVYTHGASESMVGALIQPQRHDWVLATKLGNLMSKRPNEGHYSRVWMLREVEHSLRRLQTDYIDLLYLHMWDYRTPVEEILRAFDDLIRSGKVLYAGLSDLPAWQASRMQAIADLRGWSPFCALQISYSLIERTVERELIPMAREMGMGVSPWSPLGGGVLSGKYGRGEASPRKDMNTATGRLSERTLGVAEVVCAVADEIGCTPAQVALAWTMKDPVVASPVLGVRTPAQLEDNLGALEITLGADHLARLDAVSKVPLGFPHETLQGPFMATAFGGVEVEKRG